MEKENLLHLSIIAAGLAASEGHGSPESIAKRAKKIYQELKKEEEKEKKEE